MFTHVQLKTGLVSVLLTLLCWIPIQQADAQPAGFTDQVFLSGWNQVVGMTFDPNGRMYAWEKGGKIWIVDNGTRLPNPLLDISDEVGNWRDFGMLGVALDPNFLSNGYIYIFYVVDREHLMNFGTPQYDPNDDDYFEATIGRITRYQAEFATGFTTVDYSSRTVLVGETPQTGAPILHESHGVGHLQFGEDGTLLATMGDGASYSSVDQGSASETYWSQALNDGIIAPEDNIGAYRCQTLTNLNGKIWRIDPATGNGVPSNPYYNAGSPRSAASRTWVRGVRNPYRFSKIPGTGSHVEADGNPGVFIYGEVGWGSREELGVVHTGGLNFGWPKYEGMTAQPGYNNPTYWENTGAVHELPKLDWRTGTARGYVNGQIVNVGSPTLPGNSFTGNAGTGGTWYNGNDFPVEWRNSYFFADYGGRWIRNVRFDANWNPIEVKDFLSNIGSVVFIATHPTQGSLYYVRYPGEIRKVTYTGGGNQAPIAVASSDVNSGTSPLTVNFSSDGSYDPEFGNLSYFWDFGDGNTSTAENPSHTYTAAGGMSYTATLTVTDNGGLTDQASIVISLNNTAPQILSTSIDGINTFSHQNGVTLSLNANVTDAETPGNLTYAWQTFLYHNDHNHPENVDNNPSTTTVLSPIGCDGATYWYRVALTVTDPSGLSAYYEKDIFPDCPGASQTITFGALQDRTVIDPDFALSGFTSSGLPIIYFVADGPATISGSTVSLSGTPGVVTIVATQPGDGTYAPAVPVFQSFNVTPPPPGNCTPLGTISREVWNNVTGTSVNDIPVNDPPDIEDELTIFEIPTNAGNEYGTRLRGYVCAPATGNYTFWIASDDNGQLWLSTNADPANKQLIASVPGWTSSRQWDKFPEQQSVPITLIQGQSYYIEALQKEDGGGDNLAVGWQLPDGTFERPIMSNRISPFMDNGGGMNQTITFDPIADKLTTDPPFTINATASSGLPVSFAVLSGPATVSGNTITLTGTAGTVVVRATQPGDGTYNPAPPVDQSFDVDPPNNGGDVDLELEIAADASQLNIWTSVNVTVTLSNTGGTAATGIVVELPIPGGDFAFVSSNEDAGTYSSWIGEWAINSLGAGQTATLNIELFALQDATPATIFGQVIAASPADTDSTPNNNNTTVPNEDDEAAVILLPPNAGPQDQTINFPSLPNRESDEPPFVISATATSGLPVTFSLISGPATLSGNVITLNGTLGTVTIQADQGGDANWNPAPPVQRSFQVVEPGLEDQTITFDPIPNKITTDPPFAISATASSGLPVSFNLISGPATLSGNTITLDGTPGTVTVRASQPGDAEYNPAPDVDQSFNVNLPAGEDDTDLELSLSPSTTLLEIYQTVTVTVNLYNNGSVAATDIVVDVPIPDGFAFAGSSAADGLYDAWGRVWELNSLAVGETATMTIDLFALQEDTPIVYFSQVMEASPNDSDSTPGNNNNNTPDEDDEALITFIPEGAGPQDQTISFIPVADKFVNDPPFAVAASATSGLPVSVAIESGPATVSGNTITLDGTEGTVTIRYSQPGDANWNPAPDAFDSFDVLPTPPPTIIIHAPLEGDVLIGSDVTVNYTMQGDLSEAHSLVLQMDALPDVDIHNLANPNGSYTFNGLPIGSHTLTAFFADADHNPLPNPEATEVVNFSTIADPGPTDPPTGYCAASGEEPWWQWISNVTFGDINNNSLKDGYGDYTDQSTSVVLGNSYPISLTPDFSWLVFDEHWRVWIDFNRDGDFDDAGEMVLEDHGTGTISGTITIPATAGVGATRMRIAMQDGQYADPCGTFQYGEVEDYLVQLLSGGGFTDDEPETNGLDFTAFKTDELIQLHWITNNITAPHHFVLEQSDDGVYFNPVIEVDSRQLSGNSVEYFSAIPQPERGAYFYRVQLVYDSGDHLFSNSRMLEFTPDENDISIFPNPASTELFANLTHFSGMSSTVRIHNAQGEKVFETEVESIPLNLMRFELGNLSSGLYLISFDFGRGAVISKQLIIGN
jgi:uncharacterized repeat protein (TIGR01451 family)